MSESWGLLFRVTTLQTLQISVTIRGLLSGTCSMPVLLVSISVIRIWTSTCIHYATNDKINMYISSYVQFLYEMLMFRLCSPQQHQNEKKTVTWKCLVQLSAYQFPVLVTSSSSFSLFCWSRLEMRALHFLLSFTFCSSPARSLFLVSSAALYAALATLFHHLANSLTFPWQFHIPWHFQIFQTSGHPVTYCVHFWYN